MRIIDLAGQKFGRWTVLKRAENTPEGQAQWLCQCQCGTKRVLKSIVLRRPISRSCGCLKREVTIARSTKHGHAHEGAITPTYWSWAGMIARCNNPNNSHFKYYGGRGIKVCKHWRQFANFLADMGEKPEGKSLDRIDNDGNYTPRNCHWATLEEQAENRRDARYNPEERRRVGQRTIRKQGRDPITGRILPSPTM